MGTSRKGGGGWQWGRTASALALALCVLAFNASVVAAAAPTIASVSFSHVKTDGATLEAEVSPGGKPTLYHFEYGLADCATNPCAKVPNPDGGIPSATSPQPVSVPLGGLGPATTYHFRVVVKNGEGEVKGLDQRFRTYLPPPLFGSCPNDFLRDSNPSSSLLAYSNANLGDCRAYEQASPVDKNAGDTTGVVPSVKAARSGGGITYLSSAGIPGGVGSQDIPSYLASREGGTWSTHGLLPPASFGEGARVLGWAPDFSVVFTKAFRRDFPNETALLAIPGAGGSPIMVADYAPGLEPNFAGATEDGSLLFESPVRLIDDAVQGKSNVYFWNATSEEITLVSVLNDETSPAKGSFAGPYDWIRGTNSATLSLGGGARDYYLEEEHALAPDGSIAYFTAAGTGKLYARLNPGKEQNCANPALACTVEVSKSEKTGGTGPGGAELGSPRPAAFQAASADGQVAYFTSEEELTNDANTGPEPTELPPPPSIGRSNLQGEEVDGDFFEEAHASGLVTDDEYIYWADEESNSIGRAELDGSDPQPAFITGLESIVDLTADSEYLYWANPGGNAIGRTAIDGSGELEEKFIEGAPNPQGVAVDANNVYWTSEEKHEVGRARLDGSEAPEPGFLRLDEPGPLKNTGLGADVPQRIVVDANHIFITVKGAYIFSYALNGDENEAFVNQTSLVGLQDIAVDGSHVYWSQEGTVPSRESMIGRVDLDLDEGTAEREFIVGLGVEHAQSIAVDSGHIYWGNEPPSASKPGNDLYRFDVEVSGKKLTDLTADSADENGAEVQGVLGASQDGSVIYFVANGDLDGTGPATAGTCQGKFGSMSGSCNLYRWEAGLGKASLVARMMVNGSENRTDAANWAATPTLVFPESNFQKTSQVSNDGSTLLFRSQTDQTEYPSKGTAELYRFKVGEGVVCVSCNPTLAGPSGRPRLGSVSVVQTRPPFPASFATRNLSADGTRVFFETTDPLVVGDTNGEAGCPIIGFLQKYPACLDVYEWEAEGTGSCKEAEAIAEGGCLYLLSTGKGTEPALFADASADGRDAFLFSRARLVGQDQDELFDVYDAAVNGGLVGQNPAPPTAPCEGTDACHGPASAPPSNESATTPNFQGPSDPKPKRSGKHKKKKHHKHKKKSHKKASSNRKAGR